MFARIKAPVLIAAALPLLLAGCSREHVCLAHVAGFLLIAAILALTLPPRRSKHFPFREPPGVEDDLPMK